mgnify:CR=1 FL=1
MLPESQSTGVKAPGQGAGTIDPARVRRLRWRARRGLLENDLLLERFFERHEAELDEALVAGLDVLLELPDNQLLDLVLDRVGPEALSITDAATRVLEMLRRC